MGSLTETPAWHALQAHRARLNDFDIRAAFGADPQRFARFSRRLTVDAADPRDSAEVLLDFSRHRIDAPALDQLVALADARGLRERVAAMFDAQRINDTERRAVLHVALRDLSDTPVLLDGVDVKPEIAAVRERFLDFAQRVREGRWTGATNLPITDVVNIGIGGSDLGPLMMVEALRPFHDGPRLHFVSNVDGAHIGATLRDLDARTTLFVIASKTFTTVETMTNAHTARRWLLEALGAAAVARHFVAVSTNAREVAAFGIDAAAMFPFWDWVGGRYSLWSSVGVSIALAVGRERFMQMLAGASAMDTHFRTAAPADNLPVLLGLLGVWYVNFWGAATHSIAPYYQHLSRFAAHIQQVDMESNGKRVTRSGETVDHATGPVVWGEPGTNGQHAYFQLLHQGPALVPIDFLLAAESPYPLDEHHRILAANCFAQAQALLAGKSGTAAVEEMVAGGMDEAEARRLAPHRTFPGNRPSSTLLVRRWDPFTLGLLVALYEHKVFVQGAIWGINSFDQWGVELGKQLAARLMPALEGQPSHAGALDGSTAGLIAAWRALRA
jgi:glucose-6-phosphate isomerase